MQKMNDLIELLRKLDIDIIDYLETNSRLPEQTRITFCIIKKAMRKHRMYKK